MAELDMSDEDAAKHPGVRAAIKTKTRQIGSRAESLLAAHRDEGEAEIKVEFGRLDGFVILDDTGSDRAAAAIEFGGTRPDGTPFAGLYVLRRAAR